MATGGHAGHRTMKDHCLRTRQRPPNNLSYAGEGSTSGQYKVGLEQRSTFFLQRYDMCNMGFFAVQPGCRHWDQAAAGWSSCHTQIQG
eukprot:1157194-Pelagomonas_calceolata.AAC.10